MDVLDRFDKILSEACQDGEGSPANSDPTQCVFMCPRLQDGQVSSPLSLPLCCPLMFPSLQFKRKVVAVLYFTALLVEHSYTRNIYNSTEVYMYIMKSMYVHPCSVLAKTELPPPKDTLHTLFHPLYICIHKKKTP